VNIAMSSGAAPPAEDQLVLDVLLVNATLGAQGGVTVDVENIAKGLVDRGHQPLVATSVREVASELRARRRGLIHVFGLLPVATQWVAMAGAKVTSRILVWTPVFHPSRRTSWLDRRQDWKMFVPFRAMRVFDSVMPMASRLTDAVISATPSEASYFRRIGAKRVELIPPGVPALGDRATAEDSMRFRRLFGLTGGPAVLIVARDDSRKGLEFGLAAFRELRSRMPEAQLLVLGAPTDHPGARQDGVLFPGWVGPADVELAYASSAALFVPSLYEGLPRAVVEAWAFGLPVVASDRIPLAPEVEGRTGRTVHYNDVEGAAAALAEVVSDPTRARRYGENGRRLVREGYLLERVMGRTIDLYEDLARRMIG
jgi:glycosyltransferase involved in cell wall biosynthesis